MFLRFEPIKGLYRHLFLPGFDLLLAVHHFDVCREMIAVLVRGMLQPGLLERLGVSVPVRGTDQGVGPTMPSDADIIARRGGHLA